MRKKQGVALVLGVLSLGMMAASPAVADMGVGPSASATIDWSTFKISFYDYGTLPTYVMSGQNQYGNTSGNTSNGWSSGGSEGSAFTLSNSEINSFASLSLGESGSANSYVSRTANLSISGEGLLIVSANYSWEMDLVEGQPGTQNATTQLSMSLSGDNSQSNFGNVYASLSYPSYNSGYLSGPLYGGVISVGTAPVLTSLSNELSDDGTGRLSASLYVTNGMSVYLSGSASTSVSASQPYSPLAPASPVPVPAAAWLLGSGVFGLLAAKRKGQA